MVELPVERRPSVHQDEAGKSAVGFHRQRKPPLLSPETLKPLIGEPTIGANFAYGLWWPWGDGMTTSLRIGLGGSGVREDALQRLRDVFNVEA